MKRILLTGGTGVLGRELVPRLQAAGYLVRVMSRRAPISIWKANASWQHWAKCRHTTRHLRSGWRRHRKRGGL